MERICLTEGVYYILLSLMEPKHGYAIMTDVEALTDGEVRIGAGTLYGAITVLLEKKWISPVEGEPKKKQYIITDEGKNVLRADMKRLETMLKIGNKLMEG